MSNARRIVAAATVLVLGFALVSSTAPAGRGESGGGTDAAPRVGELQERRTAASATRRNRDGSMTTTVYAEPVHYRAADGSWQPIDATLHATNQGGYAWRSGANAYEVLFKPTAGTGFAQFRLGGRTLRLDAEGARDGGTATVDGSQITYPAAYPRTDLRYQVGATGVRKVLDLAGPESPASYSFRLSAVDGKRPLSAQRRPDGSYVVSTDPAFVLAAPAVWEADDTALAAEAKPALRVEQSGRDLVATLSLDQAWLHAPGRRFPVHLDPSITIEPDVRHATYKTVSGTTPVSLTDIYVGSDATSTYRAALQFDLGAVPTGAVVSSAQFGLYYTGPCLFAGPPSKPCSNDHLMDVHRLTSAWTESSTFNQLTFDSTAAGSYTLVSGASAGYMTWPVTSLVSAWVNGTQANFGLLVKRRTESLGSNGPKSTLVDSPGFRPKLDVTYTQTGPYLRPPATLHANGAELSWTPSATGSSSGGYEVHRSATPSFTPDPTTLIAAIGDRSVTAYRDVTAAAGQAFTYRIKDVSDGTVSVARTVTLPAAGLATKVLQPGPADGRMTELQESTFASFANFGGAIVSKVGSREAGDFTDTYRTALAFDLRDIPPSATISSATVALWRRYGAGPGMTVAAHRITRPWREGTRIDNLAEADGANWFSSDAGQNWTTVGGDFDPTAVASVTIPNANSGWDTFPVTALVQSWVSGTAPNHGLLFKGNDFASAAYATYASDDYTGSPNLRPMLTVSYQDGSAAVGPQVSLAAPGPGAVVGGSVPLSATAGDDRRVEQVEFFVNGSPVGVDNTAPFAVTWNSVPGGNGVRSVTLRATDDAGNVTSTAAAPVSITVDNTALPSGGLTSPVAGATVGGDVTVSATATDDVGVASVAFLVDGVRVSDPDTTAPYSVTWKTLDPLALALAANGSHDISAVVTDTSGQQTTTAVRTVTVNNMGASPYKVGFALNDPATTVDDVFPSVVAENTNPGVPVQDPYAGTVRPDGTNGGSLNRALADTPQDNGGTSPPTCPANAYCPSVTVTNNSGVTWTGSTAQVWYRWYAVNGAIMFEGKSGTAFPATFANGASQAFPLTIYPPALPAGVQQGTYRLRIDVRDPATNTWFAAKGNAAVDNPIIVAKNLSTKLGLEKFHQYEAEALGAGMTSLTNVANGDMLLRWTPFMAPGRGLATMVDLTYNSLEDHSKSPIGANFSLSMSGLARIGEPIDIHPNKADEISGQSNKWVEFTDGDGTVHRFTGVTGGDGITRWTEPPGVNLYLRSLPAGDPKGRWAFTRPDKVTFYFDVDGFPTMVEDRNGNRITYTLENTPPGEDPGGPKKRITAVTDAGGRAFLIDYWSKDEAKKAHVRGKIQTITDHSGSRLDFDYYDDGNLLRITQRGGTNANGTFLPDRSFVFTYMTSNGANPAIPNPADRVNPEPKTSNQSTLIYSVRDPRGTETTYSYYLPPDGQQLRWKLKSRTNRAVQTTNFSYDLTNRVTTVTAPLSRVTTYTYDLTGKVTRIVNPLLQATDVEWSADFKVTKVTEPTTRFSTFTYNANGYLTSRTNQAGEKTDLTYLDQPVDANDTGNHLSLLATVTRPKGVVTTTDPNDFIWRYTYDSAGNIDTVTDPTGAVTNYDVNLAGSANPGTISAIRDANGNPPTTFPAYDPSGQPTQIVDSLGLVTRIGYDVDGMVRWIQDPNHAAATGSDERAYKMFFDYDSFHRMGRQSAPKSTSTDRGNLLWSGATFDANDNVVRAMGPHFGPISGDPENGPVVSTTFDTMDRSVLVTNPDTSVDPAGERTSSTYDAAGRPIKLTRPKGVMSSTVDDHTLVYTYDALDRLLRTTQYGASTAPADTRNTHACYDVAGDIRSVTSPRAGLASVTCPGNGPATAAFTATYTYDNAHRLVNRRDPLNHETRIGYDLNSNPINQEVDIATGRATRTEVEYDMRDAPVLTRQRLDGATSRNVTTRFVYDANGNRTRVISPRASDAGGAGPYVHYVTELAYDALNRLTRTTLPFNAQDGTERQYIHNSYDANGNVLWTSLPVTSSSAAAVGDTARTVMTHFDPGWIRTSDEPTTPKVHFDYTALGQQAERVPELVSAPGQLDNSQRMTWEYFVDGMLSVRSDQGGQKSTYEYDAHNLITEATDADGVTNPNEKAIDLQASYTGFDETAKSRFRRQGETVWTFSDYTYDANGNTTIRRENGQENDAGTQTKAPRRHELTYDASDWLATQLDLGIDSACKDDQRTVNTFWSTGWEKQRDSYRAGTGCSSDPTTWPKKQTTTWTQFDNGLLRLMETRNGAGTLTESHDVGYVDSAGIFVNGNRTKDRYVLQRGEGSTATTCLASAPCDAVWQYDARDRLLSHQQRAGVTNTYALDQPAQLLADLTVRAGNVTTETKGGVTTTRKYQANQLKEQTTGSTTLKYWYDPLGNLDCVTQAAGSAANCSPQEGSASSNLVTDYAYDYLSRLTGTRQFAGGANSTDTADYTYDALDRTVTEVENHTGTDKDRSTAFTHQGLTNLVTEEKQTGGTSPKTKTFSYDAYGHRIGMTDTNNITGAVDTYTYGQDVHGSVSQLITDAGTVKASYGYDAYGAADAPATDPQALTRGDQDNQAPINPYRYSGKRIDSGQATSATSTAGYDMGVRRYGPDIGRFLQQDIFAGALADLGLALDPLTQNRYALAGGNPISFVEVDGHRVIADGGGGSADCANVSCEAGYVPTLVRPPTWVPGTQPRPFIPRPPIAPPAPPAIPKWTRGLGLAGALLMVLSLSGDTAPDPRYVTDTEITDRERGCAGRTNSLSQIEYLPVDKHDRARGAFACLAPGPASSTIDERRSNLPSRYPPGHIVGTTEVGHLVARQFGGDVEPHNLVAMYKPTNDAMQGVENIVRGRLNRGERVFYAAIPRYSETSSPDFDPNAARPYQIDIFINSESGFIYIPVPNLP